MMSVDRCVISDSLKVISVSRLTSVTCVMVVSLWTSVIYTIDIPFTDSSNFCHIVPFMDISNLCHVVLFMDISGIESCGSHGCVCSDIGDMYGFCKFSFFSNLLFFFFRFLFGLFLFIPFLRDDRFSTYALLFIRREGMFLAMWFIAH